MSVHKIKVDQAEVTPISSVRNLGAWFDSHLDMSTHETKVCSSALYCLYNIRHIRKYLFRVHVNPLKDLSTLSLQVGWTIVIAYYMVFWSIKLGNFKEL